MEAYGVLSINESRASYDISVKKDPDAYRDVSEAEFIKTNRLEKSDKSGSFAAAATAGSYAEERLAELKAQREKYNANHLGLYRGGLPRKGKGAVRGNALGFVGEFHQPSVHNFMDNYHQDSQQVTSEDTVKFKHYMNSDKIDFNRSMPFYPMYYDRNHEYGKDRNFWLGMIMLFAGTVYFVDKVKIEADRRRMWLRRDGLEDMPGHHFHNRGGVLIHKHFAGFEKYHANMTELMAWYDRAYPNIGAGESEK